MDLILFLCAMVLPGCVLALGVDTAIVLWRRARNRRECRFPGGHGHE